MDNKGCLPWAQHRSHNALLVPSGRCGPPGGQGPCCACGQRSADGHVSGPHRAVWWTSHCSAEWKICKVNVHVYSCIISKLTSSKVWYYLHHGNLTIKYRNTYDVTNSSSSMASSPIPSYENWLEDLYWKNK